MWLDAAFVSFRSTRAQVTLCIIAPNLVQLRCMPQYALRSCSVSAQSMLLGAIALGGHMACHNRQEGC